MTQPAPLPLPSVALRRAWRRLRTMRVAMILLLLLGAGASVGSLFPQRPIDPAAVGRWIARNPGWRRTAEALGLFDVYGAWWFMALAGLLLVSLVGCLVPRYRAFFRAVRSRPSPSARLDAQPLRVLRATQSPPDEALARAEGRLRERRFRVERSGTGLAGEKGHLREGGSLLFHTSFLVLLIGMAVGKTFGYSGQVAVVEGERFTDTHVEYDSITEGRFFGERHLGFGLAVDDFDVRWHPNGVPKDFVSTVRVLDERDRVVRSARIRVNHPLEIGGRRVYQLSWGWAPWIRVTQRGRTLYDGPTVFLAREGRWSGVVKVPQTKPLEMGLEMIFLADAQVDARGVPFDRGMGANNPVVVFQQYLGQLNLDRPQSVYELDPTELVPVEGGTGALRPGETKALDDGIEVSFTGLRQYSVFQVAWNPGAWILLAAAVLILVGLVPALYSSRRRVWVRAIPGDGATRLEVAGHALQRRAAFEEEFAQLVRRLERDLSATAPETVPAEVGAPDVRR